jgi:hypothetical protein
MCVRNIEEHLRGTICVFVVYVIFRGVYKIVKSGY